MKPMKKILPSILMIIISLSSCYKQKELRAIGFAYKGDKINLHTEQNESLNISVREREDKNRVCFFNKKMKLSRGDTKLFILIDSNGTKLVDTFVVIIKKFKEPFISFAYPSIKTKYRREFFISDEADSSFPKY